MHDCASTCAAYKNVKIDRQDFVYIKNEISKRKSDGFVYTEFVVGVSARVCIVFSE